MGQKSNITSRWRHKTAIKEQEIRVNGFYQKAVNIIIKWDILLFCKRSSKVLALRKPVGMFEIFIQISSKTRIITLLFLEKKNSSFLLQANLLLLFSWSLYSLLHSATFRSGAPLCICLSVCMYVCLSHFFWKPYILQSTPYTFYISY